MKDKKFINYIIQIPHLYNANKIILHSIFDIRSLILLLFTPGAVKKTHWVVWGGDIEPTGASFLSRIKFLIKKLFVFRCNSIIIHNIFERDRISDTYGVQKKVYTSFFYPSNIVSSSMGYSIKNKNGQTPIIVVGHSGDRAVQHEKIFNILKNNDDHEFQVKSYLAYGNDSDIDRVVKAGQKLFGVRFSSQSSYVDKSDYYRSLSEVNVFISGSEKPIGMGTIRNVLALGKIVVLDEKNNAVRYLRGLGFEIFTLKDIPGIIDNYTNYCSNKNAKLAWTIFSKTELAGQHQEIFR